MATSKQPIEAPTRPPVGEADSLAGVEPATPAPKAKKANRKAVDTAAHQSR